jgi:glutamate N-acetyltransferase/amino-acid N-acetyltransferase
MIPASTTRTQPQKLKEIDGGVTAPRGFTAGGLACGIRDDSKDLAIIRSEQPGVVAGVFTTNRVQAAPVLVDQQQMKGGLCSAIIINSGVANACTGNQGMEDAWTMVRTTAQALDVPEAEVMIASTGVIGRLLPMDKIADGTARLASQLTPDGGSDAAEAIMTTDTRAKQCAVQLQIDGETVTIGGMAKGAGMIAPNMATMLGFVTTDARIPQPLLLEALRQANRRSFNRISVDGDMSTNDTVLIVANGAAMKQEIAAGSDAYDAFYAALEHVMITLGKMIVSDGEGATRLVEINVKGAPSEDDADTAARYVANSNLVKTAIHGADANWGRILPAMGSSDVKFDPARVEIFFDDLQILSEGFHSDFDEDRATQILSQKEVTITIDLHAGTGEARFWTCDFSKDYVDINASYRT